MKIKFKQILIKIWPIIIISAITVLLFVTNYQSNTRLIGWDNLMTEFNLKINLQRSIFSVWQEYQGLGLLGGMGHASDIIHDIGVFILSLALPNDAIRYAWTFLMLFIGSVGSYFLLKNLIFENDHHSDLKKQFLSLTGAIFYLLNLSTMQTFYVPFEAFIAHFAALPWLLLLTLQFLFKPNLKNSVFFIIVLILASPQAYIPTLFVVYVLSLMVLITSSYFLDKHRFSLKSLTLTIIIIFMTNAFWALPFAYFTLTNSGVTLLAKINQMSTQTVFLQNIAFGNIQNVMLLKGFWFNNVDPNFQWKFDYMFLNWREYLNIPYIQLTGYLIFATIFIGVITAFKKRGKILIPFAFLFIFAFTMLTTNTFPFSFLNQLFRLIPLFGEAFRFPFTKFSILAALTYSVFFTVGLEKITSFSVFKKINFYVLIIPFIALILIFIAPMFNGHLLYNKEKLNLPKEYLQTFEYFKNQNPNTRIANLPQHTFWGWEFYSWGYGGSGFLWYGIKQPILDRAFDVWSRPSENYYWEMSHAIYANDAKAFDNVLNKYQIGFLLLDKNIINPSSPQTLMTSEIQNLIKQLPGIKNDASFGNITIYKVNLKDKPENFVFTDKPTKSANKYNWGEYDKAYLDLGNYSVDNQNPSNFYPLRSLFSAKNQEDQEFNAKETAENIEFTAKIPTSITTKTLSVPKITDLEKIIYANVVQTRTNNTITISLVLKTPQIYLNFKDDTGISQKIKLFGDEILRPLFIIRQVNDNGYYVNVNGTKSFKVDPYVYTGSLGTTFLLTTQDNFIVLSNKALKLSQGYVLTKNDAEKLFNPKLVSIPNQKNSEIVIDVPKINDDYQSFNYTPSDKIRNDVKNCDNFNKGPISTSLVEENGKPYLNISSKNSTACFASYSSTFSHEQGYIAFIDSKNIKGRPLHFWLLSENEKFAPIDTYLNSKPGLQTSTFIFSPQEQYGNAYSFHFDNISIINDDTINNLGQMRIYSIPYYFLNSLYIGDNKISSSNENIRLSVTHPNESLYNVNIKSKTNNAFTLILSQSFDNSWNAYRVSKAGGLLGFLNEQFPFLLGSRLDKHQLINNWENGWIVDDSFNNDLEAILIAYSPQNLEYLGFILLIGLITGVGFLMLKK